MHRNFFLILLLFVIAPNAMAQDPVKLTPFNVASPA